MNDVLLLFDYRIGDWDGGGIFLFLLVRGVGGCWEICNGLVLYRFLVYVALV